MNEYDTTYRARKHMIETGQPQAVLAASAGPRWTSEQLAEHFTVIGFAAPPVVVRRKADDVVGTLEFTHHPRVCFGFERAV